MKYFALQYILNTGVLTGHIITSTDKNSALLSVLPNTQNILIPNLQHPAAIIPIKYQVKNQKLIQKNILNLALNKSTFTANDIDSCVITAQNLTEPVNILIDRQPYIISPTDNIITITSNEPKIFLIEPDPQSIYYFDKIEIEAI